MRIVVAGGREFTDRELMFATLDKAFGGVLDKITIISGHARGADKLSEEWSKDRGVKLEVYPAEWDRLGKAAGPIRNQSMCNISTHVIVFWDGVSTGTKHMLDIALKAGRWVKVVRYERK